ncbi:hypothetical protein [Pseudoduganella sp. OTU4001]|uniref:hypothetical protein n=1 Tax=Pseudoduganella sp. OTU4001 TaxID=3043854 RepID=UPI00313DEBFF
MKHVVPRLAGAALGALALMAPSAQASQLVPQNLTQMIRSSDVIVMGEVAKVTDGIEHGVPYTEVTLKVKGSLKKDLKEKSMYSFRQYGLLKARKMPDGRYMLPARIEGMPTWSVGEQVTTFLNKPSSHNGLTSPVGLAQGKLTMGGDKAVNGFHNQGLFKGVKLEGATLSAEEKAMVAKPHGAVASGVFLGLVKRAVKEQWVETGVMR